MIPPPPGHSCTTRFLSPSDSSSESNRVSPLAGNEEARQRPAADGSRKRGGGGKLQRADPERGGGGLQLLVQRAMELIGLPLHLPVARNC